MYVPKRYVVGETTVYNVQPLTSSNRAQYLNYVCQKYFTQKIKFNLGFHSNLQV